MPLITMKGIWIGVKIVLGRTMVTTIANGVSLSTSGGTVPIDSRCGFVIGMVVIRIMSTTGPTARIEGESGSGTAMTILGWLKKTGAILTDMLAGGLKTQTGPSWTSMTNTHGGICGRLPYQNMSTKLTTYWNQSRGTGVCT